MINVPEKQNTNITSSIVSKTVLAKLSCESIIKNGIINHHKIIIKAKKVLLNNLDVMSEYNRSMDSIGKRARGEV